MSTDNVSHLKEQCSLGLVPETCFSTQTLFLGNSCYRERLTGKTSTQDIKLPRNVSFYLFFGDISKRHITKIR